MADVLLYGKSHHADHVASDSHVTSHRITGFCVVGNVCCGIVPVRDNDASGNRNAYS